MLKTDAQIEEIAARFHTRSDLLFLGRGIHYPIALEGALKLKEISYIHAEGYPAGEMKHGPIALIDEKMPVVALMPHDAVYEKMLGNIQEVKARGGKVIAIATEGDDPVSSGCCDPERDALITAARGAGADLADPRDAAAAAAGVPHRGPPRLRRRSAAQPGEERYGRIGIGRYASRGLTSPHRHLRDHVSTPAVILRMDFTSGLNPEQREAVLQTDGAVLILAGAGSARRASSRTASRTSSPRASRPPTASSPSRSRTRPPKRCGRASRRCCGRLLVDVDLDVPRAVRPAAQARSAGHRPVARLRHLRLVRSADRRQAGDEGLNIDDTLVQPRWRCRGSAPPRTGWRGPRSLERGWNPRDKQIAKIYGYYLDALPRATRSISTTCCSRPWS